jgi:hypothetical protein
MALRKDDFQCVVAHFTLQKETCMSCINLSFLKCLDIAKGCVTLLRNSYGVRYHCYDCTFTVQIKKHQLATVALLIRIRTSLQNTKWAT